MKTDRLTQYLRHIFLIVALIAGSGMTLTAQKSLGREDTRELLTLIEENNRPWESVELSGKLKSSLLPLSPSVKIYMEYGTRLDLSIRAPFLGEVGRIQASSDTIVAINKMKKVYWSESMSELSRKYPGGLEMLQAVLLGRMVMFGEGVMGVDMGSMLSVYPDGDDGWLLLPRDKYQVKGARYGYVAGSAGETLALIIERENSDDFLEIDYDWKKHGKYDVDAEVAVGSKNIDAVFQFDAPKWDALPMNPVAVDSKYRKVDIKEFFSKIF